MLRPLLWFFGVCAFTQRSTLAKENTDTQSQLKLGGGTRIVGGTPVDGSEYPWIASLYIKSRDCLVTRDHFCGGSVFDVSTRNRTWLLTAAHCMEYAEEEIERLEDNSNFGCTYKLYADIGRDDADDIWERGYKSLKIDKWQKHEHYSETTMKNDVAIAWTIDSVNVEPIALQTSSPCCIADEQLRVLGYGANKEDGNPTATLEYIDLNYMEPDTCEEILDASVANRRHIREGMFCAYDEGHDTCQGDSGGPMITITAANESMEANESSTQVGVVSWGYGCARNSTPGVYADVGYYYYWINKTQHTIEDLGGHNNNNDGWLVGVIIICVIFVLALLALGIAYWRREHPKKAKYTAPSSDKAEAELVETDKGTNGHMIVDDMDAEV